MLNGIVADTAKGSKTYGEILKKVYEPFGYEYDEAEGKNCTPNSILFPLKYKNIQCSKVFLEWMDVQIKSNITADTKDPPPKEIKESEKDLYLLNGFVQLKSTYFNNIPANVSKKFLEPWTNNVIKKYFGYYDNLAWGALPYGGECAAVFFALKHFKPTGLTGMVIGSLTPWVEAMALYHGAAKMITAEYAPLTVQHPQLAYVHPIEMVKNWEKYTGMDFVVSFSSIEHSGLARYGDPPDPIGDLRELSKIFCMLKQGGLLYLGLPSAPDTVVYNVHRMYGYIRWPMIAAGFEFLGAFFGENQTVYGKPPPILKTDYHKQYLFVLRKK
uniref:Class I SAM-dependent methyltransferase n=1 Tax=Plectus sambesii TaxID=2011161 RepID=A0A914XPT5_9BILA